jgi:hypothetical protein
MAPSAERTRTLDRRSSPLTRTSVRLGLAFVFYSAAAVLWLSPLLGSFNSALLDRPNEGDAANYIRAEWAMERAGSTPFTFTRDLLNGAPEGLPQTPAPAILSPIQPFFTWVLSPLFGLIGSLNLFLLIGYAATGFTAFAFLDRLRFGTLPSLFGGYVVAFNAWTLDRAIEGAPAFVHGWCLILLLWALVRLRRDGSLRNAAVAGVAYALCFLVAAYFGLLGGALVVAYIVAELISSHSRATVVAVARRVGAMATVTAIPLLPALAYFVANYSSAARQLNNPIIETVRFAAQPFASYFLPSPHHPVLGSLSTGGHGSLSEKSFFFGYTTIALALYALILLARRRLPLQGPARLAVVIAAIALPLAYVSSLPRVIHVGGVPIPTTAWVVGHVTTFYRVYARFGFVVGIALAVLAAAGLSVIARRPRGQLVVAVLFAVLIFELLPGGIDPVAANTVPAHDRWLAGQPRGIVAHYPMPTDSSIALKLAGDEYHYTRFTDQPLFTEFGAGIGETREQAIRILARYIEDPATAPILAAEGVRYVVVHDRLYRAEGRMAPKVPAAFRLVREFPGIRVYVLPTGTPPADIDQALEQRAAEVASVEGLTKPSVTFGAPFHLVAKHGNGAGWHTLTGPGRLQFRNRDPSLTRLSWTLDAMASEKPRTLELVDGSGRVLQSFEVGTTLTSVQLGPFRIGPGSTTYVLRTRDHAAKGWDVVLSPGVLQPLADYSVSLRG